MAVGNDASNSNDSDVRDGIGSSSNNKTKGGNGNYSSRYPCFDSPSVTTVPDTANATANFRIDGGTAFIHGKHHGNVDGSSYHPHHNDSALPSGFSPHYGNKGGGGGGGGYAADEDGGGKSLPVPAIAFLEAWREGKLLSCQPGGVEGDEPFALIVEMVNADGKSVGEEEEEEKQRRAKGAAIKKKIFNNKMGARAKPVRNSERINQDQWEQLQCVHCQAGMGPLLVLHRIPPRTTTATDSGEDRRRSSGKILGLFFRSLIKP